MVTRIGGAWGRPVRESSRVAYQTWGGRKAAPFHVAAAIQA